MLESHIWKEQKLSLNLNIQQTIEPWLKWEFNFMPQAQWNSVSRLFFSSMGHLLKNSIGKKYCRAFSEWKSFTFCLFERINWMHNKWLVFFTQAKEDKRKANDWKGFKIVLRVSTTVQGLLLRYSLKPHTELKVKEAAKLGQREYRFLILRQKLT